MQTQELSLDLIDIHGGTQARVKTDDDAISSYADEMARGAVFPPISVYFDGTTHWLADGFHRYLAAKRIERSTIPAEVSAGGRTDALRHALGANSTNGLYRNNADKRNAVEIALQEWPDRANPVIAELCKVSPDLVRTCRNEMIQSGRIAAAGRVTGRDGKDYPAQITRQPRGKTEGQSRDPGALGGPQDDAAGEAGGQGGGGSGKGSGGAGGGRSKGGDGPGAPGGRSMELEQEARAMMRKGEMNPFELRTLMSANAHDYAEACVNLLGSIKAEDPKRIDGLHRIKRWVDKALADHSAGVVTPG
jgi:hypothetical protein